MSTALRSVTVKFHQAMFEQIKMIAEKRGESISDTIRYLIKRGLDERIYEENADLLATVVRTQIELVMDSYAVFSTYGNTDHPRKVTAKIFDSRITLCRSFKNTDKVS
ncbi:hypothetical protein E4K67_02825 [Desulfosporosinus fructosivorans]|uniref:CopG family transcriptional regulator n=1 Tax=Desulfosporosinus fructosivorans TaxID=2018669 RepID=A0A4Z0RAU6_9FIRM|nr:hypothetical protein [Desulfosporosinus fructosivorans]TGE39930.1 hypothetical protein E4K67_02825 [Desulfosporosinus fructosivorans]